jgi:antirestriction protein ArdC
MTAAMNQQARTKMRETAHMTSEQRRDIYQAITDKVIADLERGVRPWHRPWSGQGRSGRPLRANGAAYQGINVLLLWIEAAVKGYASPVWMTFRQAQVIGANVRRGASGSMVVYANAITRTETDDKTGEEGERRIPFLKSYTVFNLAQIENLPAGWHVEAPAPRLTEADRIAGAETFFAAIGAELRHGKTSAYYAPAQDYIGMPPFAAFESAESYYATLGHEHVHWTGHGSRLSRSLTTRSGTDGYAREELVAEMGAAFLCADLDIADQTREDHAAYMGHFLALLREDKRAIVSAAAAAQRAATYLHERAGNLHGANPQQAESEAA